MRGVARGAVPALLLLLSSMPMVGAAEPNPRDDLAFDESVTAVALSGDGSRLGVGTDDPGTFLGGDSDIDSWFLYEIQEFAFDLDQQGGSDPPACDDDGMLPPIDEDCGSPVRAVAVSTDGRRMVVGSEDDEGGQVLFIDRSKGRVDREAVPGAVNDVAMCDDGTCAVVGLASGGVEFFKWSATSTSVTRFNIDISGAVTDVELAPDGKWGIAAAGGQIVMFQDTSTATPFEDDAFPGTANGVAIAKLDGEYFAIAGSSNGGYRIYTDASAKAGSVELNIPGSGAAITHVDIAQDASAYVLGRSDGRIQVIAFDSHRLLVGQTRLQLTMESAVTDLAFSGDGSHLAILAGKVLQFHDTRGDVPKLWGTTLPVAGTALAIDDSGDHVVVAHGDDVRLFEAFYSIEFDVDHPGDLLPGQTTSINVIAQNVGNRYATFKLEVDAPDGFSSGYDRTSQTLAPGETLETVVTVSVPAGTPPQPASVWVNTSLGDSREIQSQVPRIESFRLQADDGADTLPVAAGGSAVFELELRNTGNVAGQPEVEYEVLTTGWSGAVTEAPGSLQPGKEATVHASLKAPAGAADLSVGEARIRVAGGDWIGLQATVGASYEVGLSIPGDITVDPGNQTTVQITVRNEGNAPDDVRVSIGPAPFGWTIVFPGGTSETTISLDPGESERLDVIVQAPLDAGTTSAAATVQATSLGDTSETVTKTLVARATGATTDTPVEDGGKKDKKDPPVAVGLVALALLLLARRRR